MANTEMTIDSIRVSEMNNQHVLILKEKERDRYLPIWIGPAEGDAIAVKLNEVPLSRPQTHDFACAAITALGGSLESVVIHRLENDTFHAKVVIGTKEGQKEIDCRPSDAIAMAVRAGAPILADEEVLDRAGVALESLSESSETPTEGIADDQSLRDRQRGSIYWVDSSGPHRTVGRSMKQSTSVCFVVRSDASALAQRIGRSHGRRQG